jgi:hypothetical protein
MSQLFHPNHRLTQAAGTTAPACDMAPSICPARFSI